MTAARRASPLLLLAYPIAVHYGVLAGNYWPAVLVLAVLVGFLVGSGTCGFRPLAAIVAAALVIGAAMLSSDWFGVLLWPPLVIYFGLATLFAVTLRPGREPLVTRIARQMDGVLDAATQRYTRHATLAWAIFLAILGGVSLALACCGTREAWSQFTNLWGYLLLLAFFGGEFLWRRRCLPQSPRRSFVAFMLAVARINLWAARK